MRAIDFDPAAIQVPDGWREQAEALSLQLAAAPDDAARTKIIDDNSALWAAVRPALREISNGKCWYTESPQVGTDVDVDHFRPKRRVAELMGGASPHPGYWWLAFNPANYRYSCIVANRRRRDIETDKVGGKADHFPIFDEATRATTPACNMENERPMLIDPCSPQDVALLEFKEDGEVMPRWDNTHAYKNGKASNSIELYNLNHSEFVKARIALRDRLATICGEAKRFFNRLETGDADHERAYENRLRELIASRAKGAPYSSFCAAYLDQRRGEDYLAGVFH